MSGECDTCGEHCLDCEWLITLSEGSNPPAEQIPVSWVNLKGREEHASILRDSDKMWSLGLDPAYEKMVYLKRWGNWLNGSTSYDGK